MNTLLKRMFLAGLGVLAGLWCAEGILRMVPRYRFEAMVYVTPQAATDLWRRCYRPSRAFGHELIPRARPEINAWGMWDRDYPLAKTPGTFRILLLGDSLAQSARWPVHVEERLNDAGPCEVLNAAVNGWSLYQYHAYVLGKGRRFSPDLTLLSLCLNDVAGADWVATFQVDPAGRPYCYAVRDGAGNLFRETTLRIDPWLFRWSALYRCAVCHMPWFMREPVLTPATRRTRARTMIADMQAATDRRLCAVIFPYLKPLNAYTADEREDYHILADTLRDAGVPFLDLTAAFNEGKAPIAALRALPYDQVHFGAAGDRLAADQIAPWLRERVTAGRRRH